MENLTRNLPPHDSFALIELIGIDAHNFGQRMFTRNINDMSLNEARLSLFLTAEGRIRAVFWVIKVSDGLLLLTPSAQEDSAFQAIEQYHFADRFETRRAGPFVTTWTPSDSVTLAQGTGRWDPQAKVFEGYWRRTLFLCDVMNPLPATAPNVANELAWLQHRLVVGMPQNGFDYNETSLVFAVGLDELCDPSKGCYVGQEVVERVRTYGKKKDLSHPMDEILRPTRERIASLS